MPRITQMKRLSTIRLTGVGEQHRRNGGHPPGCRGELRDSGGAAPPAAVAGAAAGPGGSYREAAGRCGCPHGTRAGSGLQGPQAICRCDMKVFFLVETQNPTLYDLDPEAFSTDLDSILYSQFIDPRVAGFGWSCSSATVKGVVYRGRGLHYNIAPVYVSPRQTVCSVRS